MTVDPSAVTAAEGAGAGTGAQAAAGTVGKYRLDRVIGSGGMGVVWAAFDPDLERPVAVKLLHSESNLPALRSRLLREARAMARLRHANVVTVFDVGTEQNRDYIAMELVDGGTLADWLDTKPARTEILEALLAAGRGLAAAHTAGLVHRDFKPHNVLRGKDGHIYVTDFGLARGQIEDGPEVVQVTLPVEELASGSQPRRARDPVLDSPLTQTGVLIGTPAYMAPEQFRGRVPDPRSDQFAFCVTAWEALTSVRPFRGATLEELEAAAGAGVRDIAAEIAPPVRAVLERGLDPSPEARWPDMPSLLAALGRAIAEPRPPRRRRWWIPAVALGGVGIAGAITAFVLHGRSAADACVPADEAFASVWGPGQRAAFSAVHHDVEAYGARSILEEGRQVWTRAYEKACARPRSTERTHEVECLLGIRDDAARVVTRLVQPGSTLDLGELALLGAGLELCDPDHHVGE